MRLFQEDPRWPNDEEDFKSRTGVVVSLFVAILSAYFAYHFHNKVEMFKTGSITTEAKIVSVEEGLCSFTDFCPPKKNGVLEVSYAFHTIDGEDVIASLRHPGTHKLHHRLHRIGRSVELHYLKSDPQQVVTSDKGYNLRLWTAAKYVAILVVALNLIFAFMYAFRLQSPIANVWSDPW